MQFDNSGLRKALQTKRIIEQEKTLRQVCQECNIGIATLSRIERGKTPDLMSYAKICKWLNVSLDKFFKNEYNTESSN